MTAEHDESAAATSAAPSLTFRYRIAMALFLLAAAVLGILARRERSPARIVIDGPSMATTFCGSHWRIRCSECRFSWQRAEAAATTSLGVICPNCAARLTNPQEEFQPAEEVQIDREAYRHRPPQRGDVVAIQRNGAWLVKRIVGLPGEEIMLDQGDLYANGKRVRWNASCSPAPNIIVHDDLFRTPETKRWNTPAGATGAKAWQSTERGYRLTASQSPALSELCYAHERFVFGPNLGRQRLPMVDDDSFNSGPPREMNVVTDFGVRGTAIMPTWEALEFRLLTGDGWVVVRWSEPEEGWQLVIGENVLERSSRSMGADSLPSEWEFEFFLRDGRAFFFLQQKLVLTAELPQDTGKDRLEEAFARPVVIAARGEIEIFNLQIRRDLVYLSPRLDTQPWAAPRRLRADEYFVLGDNSPVSVDSRQWEPFAVQRTEIIGCVVK